MFLKIHMIYVYLLTKYVFTYTHIHDYLAIGICKNALRRRQSCDWSRLGAAIAYCALAVPHTAAHGRVRGGFVLKQYHAKERGCCLRDMDFLVKKFQLLVPSLCFGVLELREGSLSKNYIIALAQWYFLELCSAFSQLETQLSSNCSVCFLSKNNIH